MLPPPTPDNKAPAGPPAAPATPPKTGEAPAKPAGRQGGRDRRAQSRVPEDLSRLPTGKHAEEGRCTRENAGQEDEGKAADDRNRRDRAGPRPTKPKPKPEKITWAEQRKWRDGVTARLQSGSGAYYLTRKIVSTHPRTATMQVDGPAGFKLWVNGELVHSSAPPPPAPVPPNKDETKKGREA